MLVALLLVPLIGVLFLLPIKSIDAPSSFLPTGSQRSETSQDKMKKIALFFSLINFLISIIM